MGNTSVSDLQEMLQRHMGMWLQLKKDCSELLRKRKKTEKLLFRLHKIRSIFQEVAQLTQKELEYHVSEIVTLALEAVFEEPYSLKLSFEQKRGKTEAVISFERDGREIDPLSAAGCGAVDIASFALRVALWSLRQPRSRATLVLDEPFKNLSADLQSKASAMVSLISKRLGLQMIIVTHNSELIGAADKVFRVTQKRGRSKVRRVKKT